MILNRWNDRFSKTTRGRVLALLRPASRTVDELATALGLTDNAVRAHLATLERDGLVKAGGLRRSGPGKPPQAYALTPEAERLFFSSACAPFLLQFLHAASARLGGSELTALMRSVGEGLAAGHAPPTGAPRARVEAVARALDELGGTTKVENGRRGLVIRSLILISASRHSHGSVRTWTGLSAGMDFLLALLLIAGLSIATIVINIFGPTPELIASFAWVLAASFVVNGLLLLEVASCEREAAATT